MKNYLVIILSFVLCLSLAACSAVNNREDMKATSVIGNTEDSTAPVIENTEGGTEPVIENTEGSPENENSSLGISVIYAPEYWAEYEQETYDSLKR